MKKFVPVVTALAFAFPLIVSAQTSVQNLGAMFIGIINTVLVPLVFAIAFLVFIWGIAEYFIFAKEDSDKRKKAVEKMLYGIGGFFVMVSVWGLVNILLGTFNLNSAVPNLPNAPGPR